MRNRCPIHNLPMYEFDHANFGPVVACTYPKCKYSEATKPDSIDPFEREKLIQAGELDDQMPGYEEMCRWLERMPTTWLPGLTARCAQLAVLRPAFKDKSAAVRFCTRAIEVAGMPPTRVDDAPQ